VSNGQKAGSLRSKSILVAVLGLGLVGAQAAALAAPTVTLRVHPLPILGFPGTGDFLGAGAEIETQVTISGSEYGGFPSPMTGLNIYAPAGVKITPQGFPTCTPLVLESMGPGACPKRSRAGPPGVGLGAVAFGSETVLEKVTILEFFAPQNGLTFYVEGRTPANFEILEKAHWVRAGNPFGPELMIDVPLVETVPGAPDASVLSFKVRVGAAYKVRKRTVSYITSPKRCPKGGFPVKMAIKFLSGETVTALDKVSCPRR
jgi:hypothetical protein